jgi:fructose-1,6-bisphosphatase I
MEFGLSLQDFLSRQAGAHPLQAAVAEVIETLAATSAELAEIIALGGLEGRLGESQGTNAGGDVQKALDMRAHDLFRDALLESPVAAFASEEADDVEILNPAGSLCLAMDPIDGSGNIDLNMPVGTIFSILPMPAPGSDEAFTWPGGRAQLAAGFVVYGPQTTLLLTTGRTVDMFTLDRRSGSFRLSLQNLRIPTDTPDEYAINASNYRHWEEPVRAYVDECVAGVEGPHGRDFNMRWHGAMVAEAYRILTRGGIFLYPADARKNYREGRLRLIYEAYPVAFLVECAGGAASNGRSSILDLTAKSLHQHVPLIFGSGAKVERLEALHHRPGIWPQTAAPLFANRGLFRV